MPLAYWEIMPIRPFIAVWPMRAMASATLNAVPDKDGYRLPRMLSITGYVADRPHTYQHHADCRTCKTRREHKETESYGSERKAVGQHGFPVYLLEYRNLHHTCYGQSRYHAGQCNQCLIGRNIRHLPKITRGPVVADTLDAALEKKNEAE